MDEQSDEQANLKKVEHYSVMLNAFIESRNETDKQLMTISVAALGFIFSFSEKIQNSEQYTKFILILSAILFLSTILTILIIFSVNANYIKNELLENEDTVKELNNKLLRYDFLSRLTFSLALILSTLIFIINMTKG